MFVREFLCRLCMDTHNFKLQIVDELNDKDYVVEVVGTGACNARSEIVMTKVLFRSLEKEE